MTFEGLLKDKPKSSYQQFENFCLKLICSFGVCCLFLSTSSETISNNNTYIRNPSYPTAYTSTTSLTWTVNKCQPGEKKVISIFLLI